MSEPIEISEIVERQLKAFNKRDIDAIMAFYREDAEFFEFPSTSIAKGATALRELFEPLCQEANLEARRMMSMINEPYVIVMQHMTRTFPEGPGWHCWSMIYEVDGEKIARVWRISAEPVLNQP